MHSPRGHGNEEAGDAFLGNCYCKKPLRTWYRECSSGHTSGGRQLRYQKLTRSRDRNASHQRSFHHHLTAADWLTTACLVRSGAPRSTHRVLVEEETVMYGVKRRWTGSNRKRSMVIAWVKRWAVTIEGKRGRPSPIGENGGHHQSRKNGGRPSLSRTVTCRDQTVALRP
jgi:hypothetical protein